jgi:hypothetical protein
VCIPTNTGHQCACKNGYLLAEDLRSCIDLDECRSSNRLYCSHQCENTVPGYRCDCASGYVLQSNGQRCVANDSIEFTLLFANRLQIGQLKLPNTHLLSTQLHPPIEPTESTSEYSSSASSSSTSYATVAQKESSTFTTSSATGESNVPEPQILLDGLQNAVSLDFHWHSQRVFWTDLTLDTIFSAYLNGTGRKALIQAGLLSPSGLCVDWLHQLLFWTDSGTSRIELSDLDGRRRRVLFHRNVQRPRDIVVHPERAIIFWTDWGAAAVSGSNPVNNGGHSNRTSERSPYAPVATGGARIESAYLDGSGRKCVICNSKLHWPNGLTLDYAANRLYWVDAKRHVIESSSLDGNERRIVAQGSQTLPHPFSLTIFEDLVYWTDWHLKSINVASKLYSSVPVSSASSLTSSTSLSSGDSQHRHSHGRASSEQTPPSPYPHKIGSKSSFRAPIRLLQNKQHFPMDLVVLHPLRQPIPSSAWPCQHHNCSDFCLPNANSYSCACPTGFRLNTGKAF